MVAAPEKMDDWNFYNIGATTLKALKGAKIFPDRDYDAYEAIGLPPFMMEDIMIPVPVDEQGNINLHMQKEIVSKYLAIEQCRNEVISKLDTLIQQKIDL